ncbi:MAG: adenine deaminase [Methanomassiliicoccus sp.]|nr:adenine deaminase [Methanomassiliicoccus sp.]
MASHPYDDTLGSIVVKHVDGQLVDVLSGEIHPACVNFYQGVIVRIERKIAAPQRFILPGLIDAHVHIESSLLTPYRYAELAVAHGTAAVVANPHEIANVMGMPGIQYMLDDGRDTPLHFYYTAPSSVPSTAMETAGAVIGWEDVKRMLSSEEFVALGEVMNIPGVLTEDPALMAKIEVASQLGKPVDGHCPGLTGYDLDRYMMAGISTDHECATLREAEEKHRKGMTIMVREGSAAQDFEELLPFAKENKHFLVTDDLRAKDMAEGHVDALLRKAIAGGMDPIHAVRAVTRWPAEHYSLPGGSLYDGGPADLTVVSDLSTFRVLETWIGGELVAKDGVPLFTGTPTIVPPAIAPVEVLSRDLRVTSGRMKATVRAIKALPGQIASLAATADLEVEDGTVIPDPEQDVLLIAVANRYQPAPPAVAFAKGFGLLRGAMASSVAHDSHNLIGVGTDPVLLAQALNAVVAQGGGYYATDGAEDVRLELPVAGLMTAAPWAEVIRKEEEITAFLEGMGCPLPAPFMTLSFQSLLTVPDLKLGDRGLYDTVRGVPVSPVVGEREPELIVDASP